MHVLKMVGPAALLRQKEEKMKTFTLSRHAQTILQTLMPVFEGTYTRSLHAFYRSDEKTNIFTYCRGKCMWPSVNVMCMTNRTAIQHIKKHEVTAHTHPHTKIAHTSAWRLTSIMLSAPCQLFLKSDSHCASFLCEADPQIGSRDVPHIFLLLNGEINLINLPSGNGLRRDEQTDS